MPRIPNYTDDAGVPLNTPLSEGSGFRLNDNAAQLGMQGARMHERDFTRLAQIYNQVAMRQQAMINNIKVSEAQSAALDEMNRIHTDLMNQQGTNVLAQTDLNGNTTQKDLMGRWQDAAESIRIRNRNGLQNDVQRAAYDRAFNELMPEKTDQIFTHQLNQTQNAMNQQQEAVTNGYMSNARAAVQMGDFTGAKHYMDQAIASRAQTYAINGMPWDAQVQNNQDLNAKFLDSIKDDVDPISMGRLTDTFKTGLRDDQYNAFKKVQQQAEIQTQARTDAAAIIAKRRLPDGSLDMVGIRADAKNYAEINGRKKYMTQDFDVWLNVGYAAGESGGDETAYNADSGAYGQYQITPELWVDLMRRNGLPEDTPMTPENQNAYFVPYAKDLFQRLGPEGAAVALYAGEQNGVRWTQGLRTGIGDDGQEYSFDAPQGKYPSVAQYVANLNSRVAQNAPSLDTTVDPEYEKALNAEIQTLVEDYNVQESQTKSNHIKIANQWAMEHPNATSSEIMEFASSLETDVTRRMAIINQVKDGLGMQRSLSNWDESNAEDQAYEYILAHPEATTADLRYKFPNLPAKTIAKFAKANGESVDANAKWKDDAMTAYMDGVVKNNKLNGAGKANLLDAMNGWAIQFATHHGRAPTYDEKRQALNSLASKITIQTRGIFGDTTEETKYPRAALPPNWTPISESTAMDPNGNILEWDEARGEFKTEID